MTIVIAGWMDFDPALRDRTIVDAQALIDGALAERGCRAYSWSGDFHNPARIHVFEEWDTEADLAAHLASEWYLGMSAHLRSTGITGWAVQKYRVDLTEPVYDPDGRPRADFFTATA